MKLALLGSDDLSLSLARTIAASPEHELVVACQPRREHQDQLWPLIRPKALRDDWESLLHHTGVEGVIVARPAPGVSHDDALRKLVQAAVPLLIVHPACEAIVGFELDMIRRDTQCPIVALCEGRWHPALEWMLRLVSPEGTSPDADSSLGPLEQVTFERSLADRGRQNVLAQLACDVSLLRPVMGEITKITATGADASSPSLANLAVSLTGRNGLIARWTVAPADRVLNGQLTLVGAQGRATLSMPAGADWKLSIGGDEPRETSFPDWSEPSVALAEFAKTIAGKAPVPTWIDACRDLEVADTVEISIRRGRTLDLSTEEPTEEGTFKGIMAVGSCALLMLTLLVLFVGSVIEGVRLPFQRGQWLDRRRAEQQERREPDAVDTGPGDTDAANPGERTGNPSDEPRPKPWPVLLRLWPVYPFALFLLLQLLRLVFRTSPGHQSDRPGAECERGTFGKT